MPLSCRSRSGYIPPGNETVICWANRVGHLRAILKGRGIRAWLFSERMHHGVSLFDFVSQLLSPFVSFAQLFSSAASVLALFFPCVRRLRIPEFHKAIRGASTARSFT